jgi:hypothetical protein
MSAKGVVKSCSNSNVIPTPLFVCNEIPIENQGLKNECPLPTKTGLNFGYLRGWWQLPTAHHALNEVCLFVGIWATAQPSTHIPNRPSHSLQRPELLSHALHCCRGVTRASNFTVGGGHMDILRASIHQNRHECRVCAAGSPAECGLSRHSILSDFCFSSSIFGKHLGVSFFCSLNSCRTPSFLAFSRHLIDVRAHGRKEGIFGVFPA